LHYLKWPVVVTFLLYPALALNLQKGANICFYLLVLSALVGIACRVKPLDKSFTQTIREYWPLVLAMISVVGAIFCSQLLTGQFVAKPYDMPSRLALFALIFWGLLLVPGPAFRQIHWGLAVGAVIAAIKLYVESHAGEIRPVETFSTPLIPFGNMVLLMGVLALLSIGWNKPGERISIACKVIAGCAGLYASFLSQARGGWLAIPLFIFIAAALYSHLRMRHKLLIITLLVVMALAVGTQTTIVRGRLVEAKTNIGDYLDGRNLDTSLGVRLQLWQASWLIFKQHPVVGVGPDGFPVAIQKMAEQHVVTTQTAREPHSHNDILYKLVTLGAIGGLALLLLYFVPAFYFFGRMRDPDRETRTIASMGLALCLGFFVFGLSDVMFFWASSNTFYSVILAGLLAHLIKRQTELERPS
jgi:O-antigen ligase